MCDETPKGWKPEEMETRNPNATLLQIESDTRTQERTRWSGGDSNYSNGCYGETETCTCASQTLLRLRRKSRDLVVLIWNFTNKLSLYQNFR